MSSKEIRIEAKTIEAAVVMACVKLGVTQENIEYEVIKQPKTGLMGLFGGKAEIKAWPKSEGGRQGAQANNRNQKSRNDQDRGRGQQNNRQHAKGGRGDRPDRQDRTDNRDQRPSQGRRPDRHQNQDHRRPERPKDDATRAPAEPLTAEQLQSVETEIKSFCIDLCEKIIGQKVAVTTRMSEDRLQVEIDNAEIAQMIQEQEKFVESLEHLLRKKPRHLKQDLPFRIFVDAQDSRKGREGDIAKLAREKADQVVQTGQKAVMDLRSAADRKIVHMTLENDDRVYTKSIGNGSGRKLLILPSRGQRSTAQESASEI
jgi:spoIIIJ-associated protein